MTADTGSEQSCCRGLESEWLVCQVWEKTVTLIHWWFLTNQRQVSSHVNQSEASIYLHTAQCYHWSSRLSSLQLQHCDEMIFDEYYQRTQSLDLGYNNHIFTVCKHYLPDCDPTQILSPLTLTTLTPVSPVTVLRESERWWPGVWWCLRYTLMSPDLWPVTRVWLVTSQQTMSSLISPGHCLTTTRSPYFNITVTSHSHHDCFGCFR